MKPWINEDIFKSWTDAQKRLWESLCSAVPFQPPAGVEAWRETYLNNLNTWEAAVKRTLEQEVAWVEQWVHRVAQERGTPEMMTPWVRQMEEVLQRWVQTQNQWWEEYFAVLRRSGLIAPVATNPTDPVVESAPAETPTVTVVEPVAVEVAEPVVVEPVVAEVVEPVAVEPVAVEVAEPVVVEPVAVEVVEPVAVEPVVVEVVEPVAVEPVAIEVVEPIAVEPVAVIPPVVPTPDDLKLITGIGRGLEKKLRGCGIATYRQLATLNDAEIARVETTIRAVGRIRRDDWIGQAKARHFDKYQEVL